MNVQNPVFEPVPKEDVEFLGTEPIPAGPYYLPEYFELEREAIFKRTWMQIGHICELPDPGSFIVREFEVGRTSLLITKTKSGEIQAFHNVCTHRGTQLVHETNGQRSRFSCPYHAWTYSNEGNLLSAPDFDKFYVDKSQCGLTRVHVDTCAGFIFVNLDKKPVQPLKEYLGPIVEELEGLPHAKATAITEYVYEVDANWKLTYDNFQENYHLRFIHPRSGEAAGGPDNPFGYPEKYEFFDPHRTQKIWSNPAPNIKPFQGFSFGKMAQFIAQEGFGQIENKYFGVFPSLFIFGSAMTPFSQFIMPIAHNRSRSVIRLYWIGEDQNASHRFARENSLATALDIHSEDRAVIEWGQKGLESGALEHIHFMTQESLCRHLFLEVDKRVQAYKAEQA